MKAVLQRVKFAKVSVDNNIVGSINAGLLVFVGIGALDQEADRDYIIKKIINMRIFEDEQAKMNRGIQDVGGEILVVSQFTLYADCSRGNRPSFTDAMPPEKAELFFNDFVHTLKQAYPYKVATGTFRAYMHVELCNDGPITILIDSASKKVI